MSIDRSKNAKVFFCQGKGDIIGSNNTQLKVKVPPMNGCTTSPSSYILFGNINTSIPFSYSSTTPTITSLSVNSSSPIQNITLCVFGTGFGSNATHLHLIR